MVDRFLRYSLEHGRVIWLIVARAEGGVRRAAVTVTAITGDDITCASARAGKTRVLPRRDILAAGYARGDEGDTLRHEAEEGR